MDISSDANIFDKLVFMHGRNWKHSSPYRTRTQSRVVTLRRNANLAGKRKAAVSASAFEWQKYWQIEIDRKSVYRRTRQEVVEKERRRCDAVKSGYGSVDPPRAWQDKLEEIDAQSKDPCRGTPRPSKNTCATTAPTSAELPQVLGPSWNSGA